MGGELFLTVVEDGIERITLDVMDVNSSKAYQKRYQSGMTRRLSRYTEIARGIVTFYASPLPSSSRIRIVVGDSAAGVTQQSTAKICTA